MALSPRDERTCARAHTHSHVSLNYIPSRGHAQHRVPSSKPMCRATPEQLYHDASLFAKPVWNKSFGVESNASLLRQQTTASVVVFNSTIADEGLGHVCTPSIAPSTLSQTSPSPLLVCLNILLQHFCQEPHLLTNKYQHPGSW